MKHALDSYAKALAALGHEARLCIFRLLVRAGEDGLNVGDIVAGTGLPASTTAHHLRTLVGSGLVVQSRDGREIVNRIDYAATEQMIGFLTSECCSGVTLTKEDAA